MSGASGWEHRKFHLDLTQFEFSFRSLVQTVSPVSYTETSIRDMRASLLADLFRCTFWKAQQCERYVSCACWSLLKSCTGGSSFSWGVDSAISFLRPPRIWSGSELRAVLEMSLPET